MSRPSSAAGQPGRSGTPIANNRNLANLRKAQMNNVRSNENVLASLRSTQLAATTKPVLPAELIATILDYLPVPDLVRCARVSRRLQEMVYDDTRWIQKLKAMGVWNDGEARRRFEEGMKRRAEAQSRRYGDEGMRNGVDGRRHAGSVTLFDAGVEDDRYRKSLDKAQQSPAHRRKGTLTDGFEELSIGSGSPPRASHRLLDTTAALDVLDRVRSTRGHARQEFGKVYAALGPLYVDLTRSLNNSNPLVFRTYRDPEQQAQVLSQLRRFARCDDSEGYAERVSRLESLIGMFENAVLREFEQGLAADDVEGRMKRYAHVLVSLNGGAASMDAFISNNLVMTRTRRLGNLNDCLDSVAAGHVDLNPSQRFFEQLAGFMVDQASIIDIVFPPSVDVLTPFLSRLCDDLLSDSLTTLFDEAHIRGSESYVKAVSGTFEQAMRFVASLKPTKASPQDFLQQAKSLVTQCYEKHTDLYLTEELAFFKSRSTDEVARWEKELHEQQANAESFFMSNVQRQAAKRDFLSSFKKVVMMPVNAFPLSSPFGSTRPQATNRALADLEKEETAYSSRPRTPTLSGIGTPNRPSTPQVEPPTTELAAKAAIMNSRLEGIKSLFSIEVALNLTHLAKASIERAAIMAKIDGKQGEAAKEQCGAIFVELLHILGNRHIRTGFDKAVEHLGNYNPREYRNALHNDNEKESAGAGIVEPLVTFLELVNVGDLIQQMIDVFYSQELIATKLTDRDDFLAPSGKEKKRFEQMLDERVAAGLNKGIDVLMDEVEYICATTQLPTDFNPVTGTGAAADIVDIGPSATSRAVVETISSHTGMLVGSTDKTMLDVFLQEVGLRLFGTLCKHIKRQRISVSGSIKLISDINHYASFASNTLRQKPLIPYFTALRELGQIYLVHIDPPGTYFGGQRDKRASLLSTKQTKSALQAKELAAIIADGQRYCGIFPAEEVYEFAERRADWYLVRGEVERAMYGVGCSVM